MQSHAHLGEWTSPIALTSLRPANPQSAALLTSSSTSDPNSPSSTPLVSALDVLLTLWPDDPLSSASLPVSELVWSVLSGVGFDAAAFPDARPSQLAELARIGAFPLILQHRQWTAVRLQLEDEGLWPSALPADVQAVEEAQRVLEERILDARAAQRRLLAVQEEVDEEELDRFLHVLNDRRIELDARTRSHAAARQLQHSLAAAAFDATSTPHARSRAASLHATSHVPSGGALGGGGVYGHFKPVTVTAVGRGVGGEGAAAERSSRSDSALSSRSGASEEEQKERLQRQQRRW